MCYYCHYPDFRGSLLGLSNLSRSLSSVKGEISPIYQEAKRIREFAQREGWTLKEVADLSGVAYNTVKSYARSPGISMIEGRDRVSEGDSQIMSDQTINLLQKDDFFRGKTMFNKTD